MKVLAIILARAGSKGIKDKNLQKVGTKSLLEIAINSAKNSQIFDDVIVSTDGQNLKQEALRCGARVVDRPLELAMDNSTSINSMIHALNELNLTKGICVLLQPTSPFRDENHIKEAFKKFQKSKKGSLISVKRSSFHPYKNLIFENDKFIPVKELKDLESPRQVLPPAFTPNGAIYINFIEDLLKFKRFFIEPINIYEMDEESSLDIDTNEDLQKANILLGTSNDRRSKNS